MTENNQSKRDIEVGRADESYDSQRAELFDALGHPTRINILQILADSPQSFSELKRKVGVGSSGNLSFHLGKLENLVRTNSDRNYVLTDDGQEAVRVIETSVQCGVSRKLGDRISPRFNLGIIAISIVWALTMIAVSLFVPGNTVLGTALIEVLLGGFLACLLILVWLGRTR